MKAAMLKAIGQPLTLEDIPEPVPGAGEVLVRVLATPVLAETILWYFLLLLGAELLDWWKRPDQMRLDSNLVSLFFVIL